VTPVPVANRGTLGTSKGMPIVFTIARHADIDQAATIKQYIP
jgi:hypothetical protein